MIVPVSFMPDKTDIVRQNQIHKSHSGGSKHFKSFVCLIVIVVAKQCGC